MNEVRAKALRLRLTGKSYNEIHQALGVPKSTLSGWMRDTVLSDTARARLVARMRRGATVLIRRNKQQTHDARVRARLWHHAAMQEIPEPNQNELRIAGIVLYWAEGYKRLRVHHGRTVVAHIISFLNSDPDAVRVFVRFLREILHAPEEKIRATMRLYSHINEQSALRHWTKASGIPARRFAKTTYLVSGASKGVRPYNRLPYGTLQVFVNDTQLFYRLMGMIDGMIDGMKKRM
jgi:DNA-binding transcriptional ArsR family regulator